VTIVPLEIVVVCGLNAKPLISIMDMAVILRTATVLEKFVPFRLKG